MESIVSYSLANALVS